MGSKQTKVIKCFVVIEEAKNMYGKEENEISAPNFPHETLRLTLK